MPAQTTVPEWADDIGDGPAEALAADRAQALATLDRAGRLPDLHGRALLRLAGHQAGHSMPSLADLRSAVAADPGRILYERHPGADGSPMSLARAVATALDQITPPQTECSAEGAALVRGHEADIEEAAQATAKRWRTVYEMGHFGAAHGVCAPPPDEPWVQEEQSCPRWQRRRLRRESRRAQAWYDCALRLPGPTSPAVSAYTLDSWRDHRSGTLSWAAGRGVRFESGQIVPLPLIQAHGRAAKRAQMYTILKGMEYFGNHNGYTAFFLTFTLPGAYHPFTSGKQAADGSYPHARPNPDWNPAYRPRETVGSASRALGGLPRAPGKIPGASQLVRLVGS